MNIISSIVGVSIMGAVAPSMVEMSIAPFEAQKRTQNLSVAESIAVTFAAEHEGKQAVSNAPAGCVLESLNDSARKITCTHGTGKYAQTVARSFRLDINNIEGYSDNSRIYEYATPSNWGPHQCLDSDPWGVQWWNKQYEAHVGACTPQPFWSKANYLASDPSAWLYDMNNVNGWGSHPNY